MPSGKLGKACFIKGTTWPTYVTPDKHLSIKSEGLNQKIESVDDERLMARLYPSDSIVVGKAVEGSLDGTMHPDEIGHLLYLTLMKDDAPSIAVQGYLVVSYGGADAYASITNTAGVLTGKSGVNQAGATQKWQFDTSNASYDTLAELAAAITLVSGWYAYALGLQTALTSRIADFAQTQLDGAMILKVRVDGIVITYTGADAYASIDMVAGVIKGYSGADFAGKSQAWSFDTANSSYDTLTELVAAIDAVTDWDCSKIGAGATLSATIQNFTNKEITGVAYNLGCGGAREHHIYPAGINDTEPFFNVCVDRVLGTNQAFGYQGLKPNSFNIKFSPKQILEWTLNAIGHSELTAQTYPAVSAGTDKPFISANTKLIFGGILSGTIKDLGLTFNNNLNKDPILGSEYIPEPLRDKGEIKIDANFNMEATEFLSVYPNSQNDVSMEMLVYMKNVELADTAQAVNYSILMRFARVKLTYDMFLSGPKRLTAKLSGNVVADTVYNHVEIYVIDKTVSQY